MTKIEIKAKSVGYWGGLSDYQWKILSIDKNKLTIKKLKEEYHSEI